MALAGDGSSADSPMRFLLPCGDAGLVQLDTWNSAEGEWQQDQEWKLHGKVTASYKKAVGASYDVGLCFTMGAPYDDTMDCMTLSADKEAIDQVTVIEDELSANDDYPTDKHSQSWDSSDGAAKEVC
eukprot:CAMPEP_0170455234 /NCGR_PEP_ID=MMETSP0123-20130129/3255_1 /TAXON_ID=182087 /ORGANISM="Favella ehrenbergii, Strain Fehren 1" /LENGTH=126 /DNA_ID=CAMNT_0010718281 /DNA_START=43 /DNA_END=423 /DNA_ORIENTATION=-